jgi:hypothetical protein
VVDRAALEMRSPCKRTGGSNPSLSATSLISRQFVPLTAPMERADRAGSGRACEPCGFEMALQSAAAQFFKRRNRGYYAAASRIRSGLVLPGERKRLRICSASACAIKGGMGLAK